MRWCQKRVMSSPLTVLKQSRLLLLLLGHCAPVLPHSNGLPDDNKSITLYTHIHARQFTFVFHGLLPENLSR